MSNADWIRVSKNKPCPICKRPNGEHTAQWCSMLRDGRGVRCMFVESKYPSSGGYMHWFDNQTNGKTVAHAKPAPISKMIDFAYLTEVYCKAATNAKVVSLAKELGLTFDSLRALRIGWDGEAWTFPMTNGNGTILGIRRRLPDGKKLSVKGAHEGLFVPLGLNGESPLFVCEGPTDTAAVVGLGLPAVGRPSCTGGVKYLESLCGKCRTIIIADVDTVGIRGANALKTKLSNATVIVPTAGKDAREWITKHGATKETIMRSIT